MVFASSGSWARRLVPAVCLALPFAVWAGLAHAFSTPKLWLFVAGATAVLVLAGLAQRTTTARRVPPLVTWALLAHAGSFAIAGWLAPVPPSLEGLLLGLSAPAWALAVLLAGPSVQMVATVLVIASLGESAIVLLQWAGKDPFIAMGSLPQVAGASTRLATYGTMGNPNFVAAWLAMHVPVALALGSQVPKARVALGTRVLALTAVVAGIGGALLTGSRAGAAATAAGVLSFALLRRRHTVTAVFAATLLCVAGTAWSTARPLDRTLAGRLYVWRVVAQQAMVHPLTGWGVGSIDVLYPKWETQRHASVPVTSETQDFVGPQQHAHNDLLEALAERGIAGVVAAVLGCAAWWTCTRRATGGPDAQLAAGFAASLVAFGVAALVDFPATRPAEAAAAFTSLSCLALAAEIGAARPETPSRDGHCARPAAVDPGRLTADVQRANGEARALPAAGALDSSERG